MTKKQILFITMKVAYTILNAILTGIGAALVVLVLYGYLTNGIIITVNPLPGA